MSGSKLSKSAHTSRPWRIHEIASDFRLEDVWELPGRGDADDFPKLIAMIAAIDPSRSSSAAVRALFAIRWKLGEILGWDGAGSGLDARVPTLRDRLPADLRDGPTGPTPSATPRGVPPFTPLYATDDEWAAEIANSTMHGILHVGRVEEPEGGFRAHMAILVKPNGLFGELYMAAIKPFRYLIVYPALLREGAGEWERIRSADQSPTPAASSESGSAWTAP